MQRVLFVIPIGNGFPIFGYGLFLMLGFTAALLLSIRRAKSIGLSTNTTIDVALISIFFGIVGARIAYLLLDYVPINGDYGTPLEWLAVWQGGLTFQGGLFFSLLAAFVYLHLKKIPVGRIFDVYAPGLAIGVGLGRIGCLFNGCCWGRIAPEGSWFAMLFPNRIEPMAAQYQLYETNHQGWVELVTHIGFSPNTLPTIPLYATQIISAVGLFLIAAGLIWAEKIWRKRQDGQVIVWFLFAYAAGRFLIEFWRDDTPLRFGAGLFPGLRLGQWLALVMLAFAVYIQTRLNRKKRLNQTANRNSDS